MGRMYLNSLNGNRNYMQHDKLYQELRQTINLNFNFQKLGTFHYEFFLFFESKYNGNLNQLGKFGNSDSEDIKN